MGYGINRMHFGDRLAAAGLEVAKKKVAEFGRSIDSQTADIIMRGYVDDGLGGGDKEVVDKLVGEEIFGNGTGPLEETGDHSTRSWLCERELSRQDVGTAPLSPSMPTYTGTVAEVQDRMESWKRNSIKVHPLYHWPGESNVADLGTKGRAEARDVIQGSDWQDGPELTRYPVERWPITRDFVREIPEEEKRAAVYGVHQSLSLPTEILAENSEEELAKNKAGELNSNKFPL